MFATKKIEAANDYATKAHEGQFRKFSTTPYIVHPRHVAKIVESFGGDENMICAALLHDVVEDCDPTHADIERVFGSDVAYLVHGMTKTYDDNAKGSEKSASEVARFNLIDDPRILIIKIADIYSNVSGINDTPDNFKIGFLKGKTALFNLINDKDLLDSALMTECLNDLLYKLQLELSFKK